MYQYFVCIAGTCAPNRRCKQTYTQSTRAEKLYVLAYNAFSRNAVIHRALLVSAVDRQLKDIHCAVPVPAAHHLLEDFNFNIGTRL